MLSSSSKQLACLETVLCLFCLSLLVVPWVHGQHLSAEPWKCPAGCLIRGNCNAEEGRCECPWGRSGPTCEDLPLSNCQLQSGAPDSVSCGRQVPRSCACYKQCHALYCPAVSPPWRRDDDSYGCHAVPGMELHLATCFNTRGLLPGAPQLSILPDPPESADWFRNWPFDNSTAIPPPVGAVRTQQDALALPLARCPASCSLRGLCVLYGAHAQQALPPPLNVNGTCMCRKGFNGTACEGEDPEEACWFSPTCGGRGRCVGGFCHCEAGWWGLGCGRSAAEGTASSVGGGNASTAALGGLVNMTAPGSDPAAWPLPSRGRLRVYMYDLPWQVAFPHEYDDGQQGRDSIYTAYEAFLKRFLVDPTVRTRNPWEANLFYIPMLNYFHSSNLRRSEPHVRRVIAHIKAAHPFWNRTGGRDHFYWLPRDRGACHMPRDLQDLAIKVVHFGYNVANSTRDDVTNMDYGCFLPSRDIVAPPLVHTGGSARVLYGNLTQDGGAAPQRDLLFFFVGGIKPYAQYSGGARQALAAALADNKYPDVVFRTGRVHDYERLFARSKFCVCPYGSGWGVRIVLAMLTGCVPVIIQDGVWQPHEDSLNYPDFSLRLSVADVPRIVPILRGVAEEDIRRMRLAMARHFTAFSWDAREHGRAYEVTLQALHRRVHSQWGQLYRRRQ